MGRPAFRASWPEIKQFLHGCSADMKQPFYVLQAFLVQLLEVLHVEVLLEGKHSTDEARNLADLAVKALGSRPLPISGRPIQDMAELPEGCSYLLR